MSRVLIADDHAVVRAGFKQFLEADPTINAVGEAASGNETLDLLRKQEWDLVLLDIHMPDRSGLDILRHIQTGHPGVRVLVMSGLPEQQYAVNVLRAGASGYLSKDSPPEELMKAVRTVLSGQALRERGAGGDPGGGSRRRSRQAAARAALHARIPDILQARRRGAACPTSRTSSA